MQKLIPIEQLMICTDHDLILDQINARREHRLQMVGWLYPIIMEAEIQKLHERILELRNPKTDFQI